MIDHGQSVGAVLEVDAGPLVVLIVHDVDVTVDDGRHHVDEEENGYGWEDQAHPVAREADVDHAVPLEGAPRVPQASVVGRGGEGRLLLAEAWDVEVDARTQLGLDLHALDHLDYLPLLLVGLRVVWSDLPQVLVDVVLHFYFLIKLINYKLY